MRLRDFTPDDYPAIIAIRNTIYPDTPLSVAQMRNAYDALDPKYQLRRWIAEHEEQVIGYAGYEQSPWGYDPHKFFMVVWVAPAFQGQGYGAALYDAVLVALEPLEPHRIEMAAREDQPHAMRWLEQRGFTPQSRWQSSALTLADFDPTPWAGLEARLQAEDIVIKSLPELQASDPGWARKHYDLYMAVTADVPGFSSATLPSFEQWHKLVLDNPMLNPPTVLAAVHGDQHVGLTELLHNSETDGLVTGLTGVRREYRRQGIATALKVRALTWAKANGCPRVQTDNEENNPMLQLNYRLGFKNTPAWIAYRKMLASAAG